MSPSATPLVHPVYHLYTADNFGLGSSLTEFDLVKQFKKDKDDPESPYVLENVPVFRSGVFRDSWGDQHTWTESQIDTMVEHFTSLQPRLPHIPVRDKHKGFLSAGGEVVGWHTALSSKKLKSTADNEEYLFLLANFEITEPDAEGKIRRGTWRNRSSEIGRYLTNQDEEIWPVYMGFAYVDLPAVEGLQGHSKAEDKKLYVFMSDKGVSVTQPSPPKPPAPPAPPAPPVATEPFVYTVNGEQISDPAEVQKRITAFEVAQHEAQVSNRKDYVKKLVGDNKILAAQSAAYESWVQDLSEKQFSDWQAVMDAAPGQTLLAKHGEQGQGNSGPGGTVTPEQDKIDIAKEIVKNHKISGMHSDKIKETPSYQILVAAGIEKA